MTIEVFIGSNGSTLGAQAAAAVSASQAETAAAAAEAAQAAAEAARDESSDFADLSEAAALTLDNVFPSTAAGLAAVAEGGYFWTADPLKLWRDVSGVAVEQDSIASSSSLGTVASQDADDLNVNVTTMRRPGFYNFKSSSFLKWSSALAGHRAGVARAYIAVISYSIARGVGTNPAPASADIDIVKNSWPSVMARALNEMPGIKATSQSLWGDGFFGLGGSQDITDADPRVSFEAGWTITLPSVGNQFVLGGYAFHDPVGSSGSPRFDFQAVGPTDSGRAVFVRSPGYANAVVSSDAAFFTSSVSTTGSDGIVIAEITRTVPDEPTWTGTDEEFFSLPWTIQKASGAGSLNLTLVGFEAYNIADKPIGVYNMGASGSRVADWVSDNQPYSFINVIPVLKPQLCIIGHTVNDYANDTPEADYKADMRTVIDSCLVEGDVLLIVDAPSNTGTAPIDRQRAFAGYVRDLADEYDLPVIDFQERWVSQSLLPDRGLYYDGLHPSNVGAADIGHLLAQVVGNPGYFYG